MYAAPRRRMGRPMDRPACLTGLGGPMKNLRMLFAAAALVVSAPAIAQTKWDMHVSWPPNNFHTRNALAFAEAVKQRTQGRVEITVHSGGALGLKGPEVLRAVRDGIVPIAESFLSQQAGDVPFLSIETMPFLVRSPEELSTLYRISQPRMETVLASYNQKLLYLAPWPSQMIFTRNPVATIADFKGLRIRVTDRNNGEMMGALGMVPISVPFSDLIPALAAGAVGGVQTSAPTAVDSKLWEFLKHALHTNHTWASNMVTVNLDRWKALTPADQKIIEDTARELQPTFWQASATADQDGQKMIAAQGIKVSPTDPAVLAEMEKATRPMWDRFMTRVPEAAPVIEQYLAAVGRK
ncbi:MAG: C4-dicarboxylate ABC transporter substrate-binding protein [Methylobacterium sp.]|nr:MAG: C4-dicarboxylate ABC transporter substrate-binding protein [Methylobacterium sp.]